MAYIYILKSKKDNHLYIGSTINLKNRINEHLGGHVESTRYRRPLELIGWREFQTVIEAALWEGKYKRSHGQLERDIKSGKIVLNNFGAVA
ncbi:MAG: nuclease [Candidatus Berkelbacteria bacterium]|nr:nuclease [Candidatus Berkelbacteria bacterium]